MFANSNVPTLAHDALDSLIKEIEYCPLNCNVKNIRLGMVETPDACIMFATANVSFRFEGKAVQKYTGKE